MKKDDFTGKTIIPFVTHSASGFSDTVSAHQTADWAVEILR